MLIDTHAHLYWDEYKADFQEVLQRCVEADVTTLITVGVDVKTSQDILGIDFSPLTSYTSIGIHPHEAYLYQDDQKLAEDTQKLEQIYRENSEKVVVVGECGLDFFFEGNRDYIPSGIADDELKALQRKIFKAQIDLAKKLDLPLTVHCRDDRSKNPENVECWNEILDLVKESRGILHCYSGLREVTKRAQNLNFLISFAGNITYPKNQYLRDAAIQLPLRKIALETDCPFLAPQSSRGTRNEPKTVREIAQLIAELKNTTLDEIANQTTSNVKKMLGLR